MNGRVSASMSAPVYTPPTPGCRRPPPQAAGMPPPRLPGDAGEGRVGEGAPREGGGEQAGRGAAVDEPPAPGEGARPPPPPHLGSDQTSGDRFAHQRSLTHFRGE